MDRDSLKMRGERPFLFISLRQDEGVDEVIRWVRQRLPAQAADILTPRPPVPASDRPEHDFPPPPELADRDPGRAPGEHVGGLRAELKLRDGDVRLGRTYQQNPLRILCPGSPSGPAARPCST